MGRPRRANHKNDEGRLVGIGISSSPLVCGRKFTIIAAKSPHAGRGSHGPPRGNVDFEFSVWVVGNAHPAREASKSTNNKRLDLTLLLFMPFVLFG